ncbi:MazG-like pyrophosphohydrolase domain-containing protein [Listeria phage LP-083-1]|uniref:MazG-like pyrophosphohydrolase domain-containing protein n=1 Tax=Listeria phage LP-083-1 TaxID=1458854 RepID=A0A059T804_9CAUD|nr:MazG-like pyrophosphohydrolase domain-containing protein [Listeria phage LP-083-1]
MTRQLNETSYLIQQWSRNKGLDTKDPRNQMLKVVEEVGETTQALVKGDKDHLPEEIGDIFVTIVILAQQIGLTIEQCAEVAYYKISERQGKIVDGIFVKEEDLK